MAFKSSADVTPLGYVLLCEIQREPRGGYALRRLFEMTPLAHFSSSPGSIYPALKRLEDQGLIMSGGSGRGGRFEIAASGRKVLDMWFAKPVTLADVTGRLDMCLLRFAFLEHRTDQSVAPTFLASLIEATKAREAELAVFLDSAGGALLPLHGRLAVEHGLRSIRTTGEWALDALSKLTIENGGDQA